MLPNYCVSHAKESWLSLLPFIMSLVPLHHFIIIIFIGLWMSLMKLKKSSQHLLLSHQPSDEERECWAGVGALPPPPCACALPGLTTHLGTAHWDITGLNLPDIKNISMQNVGNDLKLLPWMNFLNFQSVQFNLHLLIYMPILPIPIW